MTKSILLNESITRKIACLLKSEEESGFFFFFFSLSPSFVRYEVSDGVVARIDAREKSRKEESMFERLGRAQYAAIRLSALPADPVSAL